MTPDVPTREDPGRSSMVPTRLGDLHVTVVGAGPVLVLWHSLFVDSRTWDRLRPDLARRYRLVIIDGPSHGDSAPVRRRFTLEDCAGCALDVLDHLGIGGPVDWLGNAWGGHVGIVLAAAHPDRVRTLVTVGAPVHPLSPAEHRRIGLMVAAYRVVGAVRPLAREVSGALLGRALRDRDPAADHLVVDSLRRADRRGLHAAMHSLMLDRPDSSDAVRRITGPTLFVAGIDDPLWTPTQAAAAAELLRAGAMAEVPGAGHVAPLLEPGPALPDLLAAFHADPAAVIARARPAHAGGVHVVARVCPAPVRP